MFINKIFVLFLVWYCNIKLMYCDYKIAFRDDRYFEGDFCNRKIDDASGECKLITDCPKAQEIYQNYGIKPDVCDFKYSLPIVCCSESNLYYEQNNVDIYGNLLDRVPNGISLIKCREYERIANNIQYFQYNEYTDLPHLAAIGWTTNYYTNWKCDGSLISKNFVLASASCLAKNHVIPDLVKFLAQDQLRASQNLGYFRITEIMNHPEYKQNSFYHDIALIRIHKNIRFGINIRPACLWQTYNINSTEVLFSKWNQHFGPTIDLVQQHVNIFDMNDCGKYYVPNEYLNFGINHNQICTRSYYTSNKNCQGYPGGTIQIDFDVNGRKQYYIVGVGSFDFSCTSDVPLIYNRVSSYIKWIERFVWPNNN